MIPKLLPLLGTAAMLCACEARIGNDAPPVADNATAAGKAEEGKVTIEAPGFNMSIDIPEGVRAHSGMDSDNGLLYPGANFSGVHVVGRPEGPNGAETHDGWLPSAWSPPTACWDEEGA